MPEQQSARDQFQAAYENRYTWDQNFPGYTADVQLKTDDQVYTGKVRINSDLSFDVIDVADEAAKKAIHSQVWEIAVHRVRRPFEETHGKNIFELGATDATGATEILVSGKSEGDRYKVRNNVVTLVHRHIHNVVVTINTIDTIDTGEGYLSHAYDSVYHDPKTGEQKGAPQQFEDSYEQIDGYWIMNRRVIRAIEDGKPATSEFAFSNIALLVPAAV